MNKILFSAFLFCLSLTALAQDVTFNQIDPDGTITQRSSQRKNVDSLGTDKEIPKGLKVWTIDPQFGDRRAAKPDTMPHMYMNTIFTTGLRGEYNTTGNLGAPRINRIVIDRPRTQDFIFTTPYDYFVTPVEDFHFTNTLSPFTNISYNTAGNRTNGEDHFTAKFGVNAGKRLGMGFKFDYIYGRGYYQNQSTSHFNYTMYGSYIGDRYQAHLLLSTNHQKVTENGGITDDNYVTHPESFDDNFANNEIPTVLENNWNRNDNQHIFFNQRYSLGFTRKVKMSEDEIKARKFAMESKKENDARKNKDEERRQAKREGRDFDERRYKDQTEYSGRPDDAKIAGNEPTDSVGKSATERITVSSKDMADSLMAQAEKARQDTMWMKDEYVPVTSFIHTVTFDNYRRIYEAYDTPDNYYRDTFYNTGKLTGDSIYDKTSHYAVKNTFAIALLEGFNKWAKAGLKAFVSHELRHFALPDSLGGTTSYNKHSVHVGGQLNKTQGSLWHYSVTGDVGVVGQDAGELSIDAATDVNLPLFGDTLHFVANGFFHRLRPAFYLTHYHARHYWWDDDDMDKVIHSRIAATLTYDKTKTSIRFAVDELKNYAYLSMGYNITDDHGRTENYVAARQSSDAISLITLGLSQDVRLGPLNWESVVTYQKSTKQDILPVPDLNIYTNLYLRFKIARVLRCDLGADLRYFTKYYAPDYSPALGQYAVQEGGQRVEVGGCPIVNAYANFHLKHTRFFVMMSHVNSSLGTKEYFFTPHYPLNSRILRFGVSWNFFN